MLIKDCPKTRIYHFFRILSIYILLYIYLTMKASAVNFLSIIKEPKQFNIPIYQRTYSWKKKQCQILLKDILSASDSEHGHFIGSIVYFQPDIHAIAEINKYLVIDGQQRLTTITLLIFALVKFIEANPDTDIESTAKKLKNYYLFNAEEEDELYFKLLLTKADKETLQSLLTDKPFPDKISNRITENFNFFFDRINNKNANQIYRGLQKLLVVDVALERDKDNPQLIFESLNSTGLNLSQADLIRNYILMRQPAPLQKELYEKYWFPMEQNFGEQINLLTNFIRDFLTLKQKAIPKLSEVYDTFKGYYETSLERQSVEEITATLFKYSNFYVALILHKEQDQQAKKIFKEISKLRMDVSYPYLLGIYNDFYDKKISQEEFIEILNITKNYVFRRAVCGIATNSLNKTFANLYKSINTDSYLESVKASFLLLDTYRRFPDDIEFEKEFKSKDIYNLRPRNYILESLENFERKEPVIIDNYTIEHIMPQNPKFSNEWQEELGEDWKIIKANFLHTIGNLTLTGYNSELSDKPFKEKKAIKGGFDDSPLFLNKSVRRAEKWNESAIKLRANRLAERAIKIWSAPSLNTEQLSKYLPESNEESTVYTLKDYKYLENSDNMDLYRTLEKRILNLDSIVRIEFKKLYIAFKADTNFVDIVPQKSRLRLSLNIEFDKINDTNSICKNVSDKGRWGNGDVEVIVASEDDIDNVITLIEQSLEEQTT